MWAYGHGQLSEIVALYHEMSYRDTDITDPSESLRFLGVHVSGDILGRQACRILLSLFQTNIHKSEECIGAGVGYYLTLPEQRLNAVRCG
jgi:hypothetical protein